jgi:hypothetical protein
MAKLSTSLLAAVVVLALLVSPIACARKPRPKMNPISHKQAPLPARTNHKPATIAKSCRNHTSSPSTYYGSGGWLSSAGAMYYGAPNGDDSEG